VNQPFKRYCHNCRIPALKLSSSLIITAIVSIVVEALNEAAVEKLQLDQVVSKHEPTGDMQMCVIGSDSHH